MDTAHDWYSPEIATFGDRLSAAREAANMTQAELARRLGVRTESLRGWEDDMREPRANRLSTMAGLLGVSVTWLINGQGDGLPAPDDVLVLPPVARDLLNELRDMRVDMMQRAEHLGRLEKKLRAVLKENLDDGIA